MNSSLSPQRPLALAIAGGAVGLLVAAAAWRINQAYHLPTLEDPDTYFGMIDFHKGVYFPARGILEGFNPYGPEYQQHFQLYAPMALYSPAAPWLAVPMGLMPLPLSDVVYFTLSVVLTFVVARFALQSAGLTTHLAASLGFMAALLASRPGHVNLTLGQITLPLVLGSWAALEWGPRRPWLAACGLALTTLKPQFGIPLIWLVWMRGDRLVAVRGALLGVLAAVFAAALLAAHDGPAEFLKAFSYAARFVEASDHASPLTSRVRIDAMVLMARGGNFQPGAAWTAGLATCTLLGGGWIVARIARLERAGDEALRGAAGWSSLISCLVTLLCLYHIAYDWLLLAAVFISVAVGSLSRHIAWYPRLALTALLAVPAVNYATTWFVLNRWQPTATVETLIASLNSAALLAALALACVLAWRECHRNPVATA